jgi:hypothetical protein
MGLPSPARHCGQYRVAEVNTHERYWNAARRKLGDAAGTRALTEVLLAHRTLPAGALLAAMDKAVGAGVLDPQAVQRRGPLRPPRPAAAR